MIADEFTDAREDEAPVDTLEAYFEAHGWTHERIGDDEVVANVTGNWTQYELRGVWREEDRVLQFLALPDIRVPADIQACDRYICRRYSQLPNPKSAGVVCAQITPPCSHG